MSDLTFGDLQFFDAKSDVDVSYRKLPHWSQAGTICFITFRTEDSIPRAVLQDWIAERNAWLRLHGLDVSKVGWRRELAKLPRSQQLEFRRVIGGRWHTHLDECHGECLLRSAEHANMVAKSLKHFDGDRYVLTDFVVMPNHVHILAAFRTADAMLEQCDSWKRFTARGINRTIGRSGRFWQQDGFDHLVRSEEEFAELRRYVLDNPSNAKLQEGEFIHYAAAMHGSPLAPREGQPALTRRRTLP